MNHHTASSTEWPTVSSPWLRRMSGLALPERVRDALALFGVEHHAGVVVEERVVFVEGAGVLRERIEEATERRPRLAVDRVRVRGGDHIRTGRVHGRVDGERGGVHHGFALDDLALVVDADEVGRADVAEAHAEGVHPEVVQVLGVTGGDVAGDALFEAELAEEPEPGREALLAVQALFFDALELRQVPERPRRAWCNRLFRFVGSYSVLRPGRRRGLRARRPGRRRARGGRWHRLSVITAPPSSGPAMNAALASTSARHASPATTVTDASPLAAGRPVRGIDEMVEGVPSRCQARRRRVLVAIAPSAARACRSRRWRAGRRPRSPSRAVRARHRARGGRRRD